MDPATPPPGISGEIFGHWLALSRSIGAVDGIPVKAQFDLLTLPPATIANFYMTDLIDGRYRSRLAGTRMIEGIGHETKGRFLDEMVSRRFYEERKVLFDRCIQQAVAIHYRATLAAPERGHVAFSRVLLPVRSDADSGIDMICGVMRFFGPNELHQPERRRMDDGYRGVLYAHEFRAGRWHACP
ncbi:MAG: PAS domain-containing protein [Thalassobaculaceae bacterium]|nr:PAS domain-containing protein [Thalassobaculaceae bacterium]